MAEKGTAVEEAAEGTSGEVLSQAQHDAAYEEALNQEPAPEDKGGNGNDADKGNEGGDNADTPPEDAEKAAAIAEAEKAEAEEKELVKRLGLDESVKVPKEWLPHLKKIDERVSGEFGRLANEINRWGSQNKQVSEQYQNVKRELETVRSQMNASPEAKLKAIKEKLGSLDKSKLPEATQRLLEDDDLLTFMVTVTDSMTPPVQPRTESRPSSSVEEALGITPEAAAEIRAEHADMDRVYQSAEFAAWANAQPKEVILEKMKTAAGHKEIIAAFKEDFRKAAEQVDTMLKTEIGKVHPNYEADFKSPEFREWFGKQSAHEQAKIRSTDPKAYIELLNGFGQYREAQKTIAERDAAQKKKNGALTGIESVSGGGGKYDELDAEDIMKMSPAEFKKLDARVTSGGR